MCCVTVGLTVNAAVISHMIFKALTTSLHPAEEENKFHASNIKNGAELTKSMSREINSVAVDIIHLFL